MHTKLNASFYFTRTWDAHSHSLKTNPLHSALESLKPVITRNQLGRQSISILRHTVDESASATVGPHSSLKDCVWLIESRDFAVRWRNNASVWSWTACWNILHCKNSLNSRRLYSPETEASSLWGWFRRLVNDPPHSKPLNPIQSSNPCTF